MSEGTHRDAAPAVLLSAAPVKMNSQQNPREGMITRDTCPLVALWFDSVAMAATSLNQARYAATVRTSTSASLRRWRTSRFITATCLRTVQPPGFSETPGCLRFRRFDVSTFQRRRFSGITPPALRCAEPQTRRGSPSVRRRSPSVRTGRDEEGELEFATTSLHKPAHRTSRRAPVLAERDHRVSRRPLIRTYLHPAHTEHGVPGP